MLALQITPTGAILFNLNKFSPVSEHGRESPREEKLKEMMAMHQWPQEEEFKILLKLQDLTSGEAPNTPSRVRREVVYKIRFRGKLLREFDIACSD
jgi:hypothetical protein